MHVRKVNPNDLQALGQIAYQTGFFGASAEGFFPSQNLFRDLWVEPYLEGAGCCGWIAESEAGKPLGYILGTCDLPSYQRWFVQHLPQLLLRALRGNYSGLWPSLPYLLRMARYPSHPAPTQLYPAQLHINLLPESRGLGLGKTLLESYLECLRRENIPGCSSPPLEKTPQPSGYIKSLALVSIANTRVPYGDLGWAGMPPT